jgi:hypothetical protein
MIGLTLILFDDSMDFLCISFSKCVDMVCISWKGVGKLFDFLFDFR